MSTLNPEIKKPVFTNASYEGEELGSWLQIKVRPMDGQSQVKSTSKQVFNKNNIVELPGDLWGMWSEPLEQ